MKNFCFGDQVILRDTTGFDPETKFFIKTHPLDYALLKSITGKCEVVVTARRNDLECEVYRSLEDVTKYTK
jgi:hypothetical protein